MTSHLEPCKTFQFIFDLLLQPSSRAYPFDSDGRGPRRRRGRGVADSLGPHALAGVVASLEAHNRRVVVEAEKLAATHWHRICASASLDRSEPYFNHQPNTRLSNRGKTNFRCSELWSTIKYVLIYWIVNSVTENWY
jgi:hypothetical protein